MRSVLPVLLCLLWSLVEVQSETEYPYISFMGMTLPDHSYVDFDEVGEDRGEGEDEPNTVQCHTDLSGCCDGHQLSPRGDWFPPGSDRRLPLFNESGDIDIEESLRVQVVHIRRLGNAMGQSGIYRCVIGTNSNPSGAEPVYVGLYHNGGV